MAGVDRNAWMMTFSDLVTLMITFFVMLMSMSVMDAEKVKEAFQFFPGSGKSMGGGVSERAANMKVLVPQPKITSKTAPKRWTDEQDLQPFHALTDWLRARFDEREFDVVRRDDAYEIHLDNGLVFEPGKTKIRKSFDPFLSELTAMLSGQSAVRLKIRVFNTDKKELAKTKGIDSLWELAVQRGGVLADFLERRYGLEGSRISMMGYGEEEAPSDGWKTAAGGQRIEFVFMEREL